MEERLHILTMFYNQLQHQEVIVEAELNIIWAKIVKLKCLDYEQWDNPL